MHPIEMSPVELAEELRDAKGTEEAVEFLNYLLEFPALRNSTYDLIMNTLELLETPE